MSIILAWVHLKTLSLSPDTPISEAESKTPTSMGWRSSLRCIQHCLKSPTQGMLLEFANVYRCPSIFWSTQILRFLVTTAIRKPKLMAAVALLVLAALASTMTYTGFLVVGVLAEYLGTGRVMAGLLLGVLFARFPWVRKGKLRIVGLLPKPARRPVIVSLLALCLVHFLSRGDYVPAGFIGFATVFILTFPWLRRALFDRMLSSVFKFTGRKAPKRTDDMVIDGEFREKKE